MNQPVEEAKVDPYQLLYPEQKKVFRERHTKSAVF